MAGYLLSWAPPGGTVRRDRLGGGELVGNGESTSRYKYILVSGKVLVLGKEEKFW